MTLTRQPVLRIGSAPVEVRNVRPRTAWYSPSPATTRTTMRRPGPQKPRHSALSGEAHRALLLSNGRVSTGELMDAAVMRIDNRGLITGWVRAVRDDNHATMWR